MKLLRALRRLASTWRWCREYEKSLNDRAAIEQKLWNVANGKASIPTREDCRQWAIALGIPAKWRDRKTVDNGATK